MPMGKSYGKTGGKKGTGFKGQQGAENMPKAKKAKVESPMGKQFPKRGK